PVYEFYCDECGCRFEEYRELKQRSACPCPECGESARKVFRPVGIIFKGSGFYVTDNRTPDRKSAPGSDVSKPKADVSKPKPAGSASDKGSSSD
ncbi:MAG: FmdB family transcriptional regulator, partial [Armatimonadota bacterium]|nr:FmdB family transcriptional regulator [Armatimonadota bacterium]